MPGSEDMSRLHSHWRAEYFSTAWRTIEGDGFDVPRAIPAPQLGAVGPCIFLDHFVDFQSGRMGHIG